MRGKKLVSFLFATAFTGSFLLSGCTANEVTIKDKDENTIALLDSFSEDNKNLTENEYKAYTETVIAEAVEIISEKNDCDEKEAESQILAGSYVIYTTFDSNIYESVKNAYENSSASNSPFGCTVTDLQGNICAIYSSSDEVNYATANLSPYSSIKPLSVYAPAIEKGTAYWSKVYEDSPYKQVENEDGTKSDWPLNASETYSYENTDVYTAIKESLNTVAVKCLDESGVSESISFLSEKFGFDLSYESQKASQQGEEEVIGNIALGYLYEGVSTVDMAGCYQIFANTGIYYKPKTISKICTENGSTVYVAEDNSERVIKESTACIMNQLLQGVVTPDGTGADAQYASIPTAGKTGTGSANDGNWFVGIVPEYSCAVWHGEGAEKNCSPEIFSEIMAGIEPDESKNFPVSADVQSGIYCRESGMLISDKCREIETGHYVADSVPGICNIH